MSAPDRYRALFLAESQELLAAAERALRALESSGEGAARPAEVDALFRAVHSLKGMCAAMGHGALEALAHDAEAALMRVREGLRGADADLVDALYAALDALDAGIARVSGGAPDAEDDDARAARVRLAVLVAEPTAEFAVPPVPAPADAAGDGLLVRVRVARDAPLRGVRAFMALQKARALGEVTAVRPDDAALQAGEFGDAFTLRLRTDAPHDAIVAAVRSAGDVEQVEIGEGATPTATHTAAPAASPGAADDASHGGHAALRARIARVPLERLDGLVELVGELTLARARLLAHAGRVGDVALAETAAEVSRLAVSLQEGVLATRLAPARELLERLPRIVREAARASGKEVTLAVSGAEAEVDRSVLDALSDPLVHLLRNAVDHGVEQPDAREAAGKARTGHVSVRVERDRAGVRVTVADDGRGIDRGAVLRKARAAGILAADADADAMGDDELLALLARPGFSTAETVTRLSGRGVGVDAVQAALREVGGALSLRSVPGEGTAITMRLPLTLAIVRALLARAGDETYVVPLTHVRETLPVEPEALTVERGRERLRLRDEVLPVVRLRAAVGLPDLADADAEPEAVVVEAAGQRAALVVDGFAGQQEVVVKRSPPVRGALRIFGGATILGDGAPALILDAPALLHWSRS